MFSKAILPRSIALAGALTLMLGSTASAQNVYRQQNSNRGFANRVVEGTVSQVIRDRNGDHVRLTNGMDLLVPNTITGVTQGRRWGASTLHAGDVVRLNVYSREGDGRDAQVRSIELLSSNTYNNNGRNNNGYNNNMMSGTVVSVDRRAHTLVMQADNGRTYSVDFNSWSGRDTTVGSYRRGDRISVSGRMGRGNTVIASDVRVTGTTRNNRRQ
ncbi:MAG: hypothetical protein JWO97_2833 [Acidobacteria bacterium]|nr:hypothetical protein [Acidobacteriota bacterium]